MKVERSFEKLLALVSGDSRGLKEEFSNEDSGNQEDNDDVDSKGLNYEELKESLNSKDMKKEQDFGEYFSSKNISVWQKDSFSHNPLAEYLKSEIRKQEMVDVRLKRVGGDLGSFELDEMGDDLHLVIEFLRRNLSLHLLPPNFHFQATNQLKRFVLRWRGNINFNSEEFQERIVFEMVLLDRRGRRVKKGDTFSKTKPTKMSTKRFPIPIHPIKLTNKHKVSIPLHFDEYKLYGALKSHIPFVSSQSMFIKPFLKFL